MNTKNSLHLSSLHDNIVPNVVAEQFTLTQQLVQQGRDLVDLTIGEPDFDTPDHIKQAAVAAIWRGETKYTISDGTIALKKAIRAKYRRDFGLDYSDDQVVADAGGKPLLALLLRCLLNVGDGVACTFPCYGSYEGMIRILGAHHLGIEVGVEDNFRLTPRKLADFLAAHRGKIRVFLLNIPNNPTGIVYSRDELRAFAEVFADYPDIWILLDEVYEKLLYDGVEYASFAVEAPQMRERIICVNSLSKSYAMTGWRLGYALGPKRVMDGLRGIIAQCSSNPSSITQAAGIAALNGDHGYLREWLRSYAERRDYIFDALSVVSGLRTLKPQGGMFLYYHCGKLMGSHTADGRVLKSSQALCTYLLKDFGVSVVPGIAFGLDPYIRLSLVAPKPCIEFACQRIIGALKSLNA